MKLYKKVKCIEDNYKLLENDKYDCLRDFYNRGKGDMEFIYKSMCEDDLI